MTTTHKRLGLLRTTLMAASAALCMGGAWAETVRIANQGDALSMDPHSLNESLQLSVTNNVYEALVGVTKDLKFEPALATSWKQTSPTVWRFELRKGVTFHDGKPFTADDCVFTWEFARDPASACVTIGVYKLSLIHISEPTRH